MRGSLGRGSLVASLVAVLLLTPVGPTGIATAAENTQDGENSASKRQTGEGGSGDAVAGTVIGGVGAGDTSVDASNVSEDVDVRSGDGSGSNVSPSETGLIAIEEESAEGAESSEDFGFVDAFADADAAAENFQEGDNDFALDQTSSATSGDAVGGQVIGVVTSAGGTADVVAANTSEDVDARTGDAESDNVSFAFTGLVAVAGGSANATGDSSLGIVSLTPTESFIASSSFLDAAPTAEAVATASNTQTNDNDSSVSQSSDAASGDAVGGQVIGLVSAGESSVDARNSSDDVDVRSGDSTSGNFSEAFTGLLAVSAAEANANATSEAFITSSVTESTSEFEFFLNAVPTATVESSATNVHDGENTSAVDQTAGAETGDGVGGQVIGAVTSAGGSADIVAENASEDIDAETGDAAAVNVGAAVTGPQAVATGDADASADAAFIGFTTASDSVVETTGQNTQTAFADVTATVVAANEQTDDNDTAFGQDAQASTGDGVAGQVIGVVSAGDTSVDATNESTDVDVASGDSDAANEGFAAAALGAFADANASGDADAVGVASATAIDGGVFADDQTTATVSSGAAADATNTLDGENNVSLDQASAAGSGDGVGGQVIGAVTAGGGSAEVVAENRSDDVDIGTGDASAASSATAIAADIAEAGADAAATASATALSIASATFGGIDPDQVASAGAEAFSTSDATNDHTGDNDVAVSQSADASSGDGVGGQVIGLVTAGDASVDAANASEDVGIDTGDATSVNAADAFAGLEATSHGDASADATARGASSTTAQFGADSSSEVTATAFASAAAEATATNVLLDDNAVSVDQSAAAASGDGVGGQVIGAVTSAGGSTDVVAENASEDVDVSTGDADAANTTAAFAGLAAAATGAADATSSATAISTGTAVDSGGTANTLTVVAASEVDSFAASENFQDGENNLGVTQAADATTGDGVGGQVIGLVSAGDSSVDARSSSEDVDITTGDADSANTSSPFVGLEATATATGAQTSSATAVGSSTALFDGAAGSSVSAVATPAPVSVSAAAANEQFDDNDQSTNQLATASSGDGVGGQVIGFVSPAGGSVDVVAANNSEDADVRTGDGVFTNDDDAFVGLRSSDDAIVTSVAGAFLVGSSITLGSL